MALQYFQQSQTTRRGLNQPQQRVRALHTTSKNNGNSHGGPSTPFKTTMTTTMTTTTMCSRRRRQKKPQGMVATSFAFCGFLLHQQRLVRIVLVIWAIVVAVFHLCLSTVPRGNTTWQQQQKKQQKQQSIRGAELFRKGSNNADSFLTTPELNKDQLRERYEALYDPNDWSRIQRNVQALRLPLNIWARQEEEQENKENKRGQQQQQQGILNGGPQSPPHCPRTPPSATEYPQTWPLKQLLQDWNPGEMQIPQNVAHLYHSLCVLDWNIHSFEQIEAYRMNEIPFVLQNHPEILRATERWNSHISPSLYQDKKDSKIEKEEDEEDDDDKEKDVQGNTVNSTMTTPNNDNNNKENDKDKEDIPYLLELLKNEPPQRNEYAIQSNHMAFWRGVKVKDPPTQNVQLSIQDWWNKAMALERALTANETTVTKSDHWYYRFSAFPSKHEYLYDELRMFYPVLNEKKNNDNGNNENNDNNNNNKNRLFVVEPEEERGINCRFGMVGNMADNHFDPTRNWIVILKGLRRYILSPPEQCPHLNLQPMYHESARHSKGNWANSSSWIGLGQQAQALQVVLQPGDALYLPTSWFHFIVSLTTSFQCNARSGTTHTPGSYLDQVFQDCGFPVAVG